VSERIAIVGATSSLGHALAREFAGTGAELVLAGRDAAHLERNAEDLRVRFGVRAEVLRFDVLDYDGHEEAVAKMEGEASSGLTGLVLVQGDQADQEQAQRDFAVARRMFEVNALAPISLLERVGAKMEERGTGFLCGIASVAGDRGRASNYLYGASKAALATSLDGMRARFAAKGVHVATVKPGFVDTRLTYGRPGVFLAAPPARVARDIARGVRTGRGRIYTPGWWAGIMALIRAIPDRLFRRLAL